MAHAGSPPKPHHYKRYGMQLCKPCIKDSDSHNVNDELGKLKDKQPNSTEKYCWVKADPTFNGLKQIINEPEDRVYIGRIPPRMEDVLIPAPH